MPKKARVCSPFFFFFLLFAIGKRLFFVEVLNMPLAVRPSSLKTLTQILEPWKGRQQLKTFLKGLSTDAGNKLALYAAAFCFYDVTFVVYFSREAGRPRNFYGFHSIDAVYHC